MFNIGDRVRHKLADIHLTIKSLSDSVAICQRDHPEITRFGDEVWTAICKYENLEHENNQLKKFDQSGDENH